MGRGRSATNVPDQGPTPVDGFTNPGVDDEGNDVDVFDQCVVLVDETGLPIGPTNPIATTAGTPGTVIAFEVTLDDYEPHQLEDNLVQDQVTVQADKANQGFVLLGNSIAQVYEIAPAGDRTVKVSNTDLLYVAADPAATLPLIVNVFGS